MALFGITQTEALSQIGKFLQRFINLNNTLNHKKEGNMKQVKLSDFIDYLEKQVGQRKDVT